MKRIIIIVMALVLAAATGIGAYYYFHEPENFTEKYLSEIYASPESLEKHYGMKIPEAPPSQTILDKDEKEKQKQTSLSEEKKILYTGPVARVTIAPDRIVIDNFDFWQAVGKYAKKEVPDLFENPDEIYSSGLYYREIALNNFSLHGKYAIHDLTEAASDITLIARIVASILPNTGFNGIASLIIDERTPINLIKRVFSSMWLSEYGSFKIYAKWNGELSPINITRFGYSSVNHSANLLINMSQTPDKGIVFYGYDDKDSFFLTENNSDQIIRKNSFEDILPIINYFFKDNDYSYEKYLPFETGCSKFRLIASNLINLKFSDLIPLLRVLGSLTEKDSSESYSYYGSLFYFDTFSKSISDPKKIISLEKYLEKRRGKCLGYRVKKNDYWDKELINYDQYSEEFFTEDFFGPDMYDTGKYDIRMLRSDELKKFRKNN